MKREDIDTMERIATGLALGGVDALNALLEPDRMGMEALNAVGARIALRLIAELRIAEQRAAAAEAVVEVLRKALVSIIMERYVRYDGHPDTPLHMAEQAYTALSGVPLTHDDIVAVDGWTREEAQAALDALAAAHDTALRD